MIQLWLILLIAGLVTYAIRLSFILLFGQREINPSVRRALYFVPPAVLSAIIFPELLLPGGSLDLSFQNARLIAGVLAALIAWRTRNILLTISGGMIGLLVAQYLLK